MADFIGQIAGNKSAKNLVVFLIKALVLLFFFYCVAQFAPIAPPIVLGIVVAVLSMVSSAVVAYHAVVRKIGKQLELSAEGRLSRLNEGRKLCLFASFLVSLWFVFWLVLELPTWGKNQWILIVSMVPVFYLILFLAKRFTKREFEKPFQKSRAILISSGILGILLCAGFAVLVWADPVPTFSSAQEAYLATANPYQESPAAIFVEVGKLNALSGGITVYGLSKVAEISFGGYLIWRVVLAASALFGFSNLLGACALDSEDIKRVFLPLESAKNEKRDWGFEKSHIVLACTLPLLFTLLFVGGNAAVERLEQQKEYSLAEDFIRDQIGVAGYLIDGKYYDQLAVESLLKETEERSSTLYEEATQTLIPLVNEAFDHKVASVDGYLDWYYSLPADYERLARFFTGTVEEGLRDQLEARLNEGFDDSGLTDQINSFTNEANAIADDFRASLATCELGEVPEWLIETKELSVPDLFVEALGPSEVVMSFGERMGVSAVSGVAGGVIAKKITDKVVVKPVFQKIVTRLLNALAARGGVELVSSAGGTAIAPGVGTAVGLLGGVAVGTVVDFIFLKVDEVANRESYKEEIVATIEEARSETLAIFQA